ncbi:UNVERIFIED_CONTAM: hypothetical protein HDU68_000989 [Siphonaria sp. JEL0065]|nr:hypothetical protein HDU68_000989 [Siphonaria sp. JEL0065]
MVKIAAFLIAIACAVLAAPAFNHQSPIIANAGTKHHAMNKQTGLRLIATSATEDPVWMNQQTILSLYQTNTKFMDVTDQDLESVSSLVVPTSGFSKFTFNMDVWPIHRTALPERPRHMKIVNRLLSHISTTKMEAWLTKFSSFHTRYYLSPSGKDSAEWLHDQVATLLHKADKSNVRVSISKFEHDWSQFSVIARIESLKNAPGTPVVIVSAHQDSVNKADPLNGRSPGADDNGSGSTTIFESLSLLIEQGFIPSRPVEFHWYSAEEAGLLGSQKVAAHYKASQIAVSGVYHVDMTGYTNPAKEEVIAFVTDGTDDELSAFVRQVVQVYNNGTKIIDMTCGYACSDYASWTKAGYRSAFTMESFTLDTDPFVHTADDTVDHLTFSHMAKFVRSVVGFAVEMSFDRSA